MKKENDLKTTAMQDDFVSLDDFIKTTYKDNLLNADISYLLDKNPYLKILFTVLDPSHAEADFGFNTYDAFTQVIAVLKKAAFVDFIMTSVLFDPENSWSWSYTEWPQDEISNMIDLDTRKFASLMGFKDIVSDFTDEAYKDLQYDPIIFK